MKVRKFFIILVICVLAALPGVADPDGRTHCDHHTVQHEPTTADQMYDFPTRIIVFGTPTEQSEFTIKLIGTEPNCPMPEGSDGREKILTVMGGEMSSFGTWSYTEAGVYHYKAFLVDNGNTDYILDTAEYTVTDMVKHEGSELSINRVITNSMNKPVSGMCFMNKYIGPHSLIAFGPDGSIVQTRTENDNNNNYYYIIMGIGVALAIIAAYDLIKSFLKPRKEAYSSNVRLDEVRLEA